MFEQFQHEEQPELGRIVTEYLPTAFGYWQTMHDHSYLLHCKWFAWDETLSHPSLSNFSKRIQTAIAGYQNTGTLSSDTVPIKLTVTPFQRRVFEQMCQIDPGQTITYGDLAKQLSTSPRAIGRACAANPIMLFIPCHRVVAQNSLGGFMGQQSKLELKNMLLKHEHHCFNKIS